MVEERSSSGRSWLSEGLFIAGAPVYAYILAFSYETGYATAFSIPGELIHVSITNLVIAGAVVAWVLVRVFMVVNFSSIFWPTGLPAHVSFRVITLGVFATFALALTIANPGLEIVIPVWTFFCTAVFVEFALPLIVHRKVPGYVAKLRAQDGVDDASSGSLLTRLGKSEGGGRLLGIIAATVLAFLSFASGLGVARSQKEFLVVEPSNAPQVVLRIYGDSAVLVPVDRGTRFVRPHFTVVPLASLSSPLRLEELGPLRLQKQALVADPERRDAQ